MFVVGLTGGIGSGKTAASDYLAAKGITVVDADVASRIVVTPGQPALEAIRQHFGDTVIAADGGLDRRALREIVFADPAQRQALEAITHPAINHEIRRQIAASASAYTLLVSPLLLETRQHELADRVLLIDAPEALQVARATARDGVSLKQVEAIIAAQMPREQKRARADDVLLNDGLLGHLHRDLDILHARYLALAATSSAGG
ncbi:dephospho-CoA kinase [Alcanivorax quisquiliarum]|uniref:Dephospho-CoA kinase n=1 Tax=Alcanivorax quisquiliarum TaxID=2933565 RepID=A0ABT0EAQ2_9GAMM|nr:dephospho-CoA kinase [Alcanivorax quisquiliarum]MCK0538830.1 dephospho-CoA kinase [Alcanivorax quisquiliarum]